MGLMTKIKLLWYIFLHREAPWSVKLLLLAAFLYLIFPMDLLPDHILLAGWLDDLALAIVMYILAMKFTPEEIIKGFLQRKDKDPRPEDREQ